MSAPTQKRSRKPLSTTTNSNPRRSKSSKTFSISPFQSLPGSGSSWRPIQTVGVIFCLIILLILVTMIFSASSVTSHGEINVSKANTERLRHTYDHSHKSPQAILKSLDNNNNNNNNNAIDNKLESTKSVKKSLPSALKSKLSSNSQIITIPSLDTISQGSRYIINIPNYLSNIYNITESKLSRLKHISPVFDPSIARPHLVGLGAEKSGSTSIGAAIHSSGLYLCPRKDRPIDTEQRYWSDKKNCPFKLGMDESAVLSLIETNKRCNIITYLNENGWKNSNNNKLPLFEKSVAYLGMDYVSYIFSRHLTNIQNRKGTKIFVMIRYPPPRIQSTWYFFVGDERTKIKDHYGNVEIFTKYLMSNNELGKLVNMLSEDGNYEHGVLELDWKGKVLPQWNVYFNGLIQECRDDSKIAGFKAEYCDTPQLLRRAVALSCYIVPIMQWLVNLDDPINEFRILQSELYFNEPKEMIRRLLCWDKQGTIDSKKCDGNDFINKLQVKKAQTTNRNSIEMSDELLNELHTFFEPCNRRLFELFQLFPQLALKEFEWEHWMYTPNHVTIVN